MRGAQVGNLCAITAVAYKRCFYRDPVHDRIKDMEFAKYILNVIPKSCVSESSKRATISVTIRERTINVGQPNIRGASLPLQSAQS